MICVWFAALVYLLGINSLVLAADSDLKSRAKFPEPLNEEQFKSELKSGLHIVEFFSPYCGHCKSLAPIWEKTWETFYEEGRGLNVTFSQVNCVLNGDLCTQEKISYFPTIRLYGPSGYIKNFPDDAKRTTQNLINFARREAYDPANGEIVDIKLLSKRINGDFFNELLAGRGNQPYLVSFWPTKSIGSMNDNIDFENCEECLPFQRVWKLLSTRLTSSNISTGHVNCESSQKLCEELGFDDLVKIKNHAVDRYPKVALVLPGKNTNNLFIYDSKFSTSVSDYEDFAKRTCFNSEAPFISAKEIKAIAEKDFELPSPSRSPPDSQKMHIIFSYDPETVVPEDFHVLEHLVEPLSKIPNAYLYKTTTDMKLASRTVFGSMYKMINYNESEPEKTMKEAFLDFNSIDENPLFYIFKEGDRIPHIFPGYSTTEMRKADLIVSWINSLSLPVLNEISASNFKRLLNFEPESYSGLAILLLDSSNDLNNEKNSRLLNTFIIGAYDYENVRMANVVDIIAVKRAAKAEAVRVLKAKGASMKKKVRAAVEEVPHVDDNKVILGYLDISKSRNILSQLGLDYRNNDYKVGDVIVIHKSKQLVYEHDPFGGILNAAAPYNFRETLVSVFLPEKSLFTGRIPSHLLHSPFGRSLRRLDAIHQFGFWGYVVCFLAVIVIYKALKLLKKSRFTGKKYRAKRNAHDALRRVDRKKLRD